MKNLSKAILRLLNHGDHLRGRSIAKLSGTFVLCLILSVFLMPEIKAQDGFSTTTKLEGKTNFAFSTVPDTYDYDGPFLQKGTNVLGATLGFGYSGGVDRHPDDNIRKPSDFNFNIGANWEQFITDNVAVGGELAVSRDVQKDMSGSSGLTWSSTALHAGPMGTYYHPCNEGENLGVLGMVSTGIGLEFNSWSYGGSKESDPVSPSVFFDFDFGFYYAPSPNFMMTVHTGVLDIETQWMNMDEGSSLPDMRTTEIDFLLADFVLGFGLKYLF